MRVVFMGTSAFALPALRRLVADGHTLAAVVTQPDRPAGRGRAAAFSAVKQAALALGLPLWQPESLRPPEAAAHLRDLSPEAVVVAAYGQILRPSILEVPPLGCLNIHGSLLPKLRGASPIAFAILEGYAETGVTIIAMDPGMDTGPILAQRSIPIRPEDTTLSLGARLADLGADLIGETLPRWAGGEIAPQPQDNAQATYTRILRKEDGRIDWGKAAEMLWREVRAYYPWPGSFTHWDGRLLKVLEAAPLPLGAAAPAVGQPGTVIRADDHRSSLAVVTGAGALLLLRLQLEGRKPMTGDEFLRGQPAIIGARLGQ
ncbi:MAG: methionyl-tRNA formyltransferase [Chloroflexi bacterium]|nr:methionyl-tRNA formyltransferase [Chloroflexota bacterium]